MKKKGVGKRILSALLAFALTVSVMPAGQLVSFAENSDTTERTATNVTTVQTYAQALLDQNTLEAIGKDNYASGGFTWDNSTETTGENPSWKYYNGMMLDAFASLGDKLENDSFIQFVKDFYNNGNLYADGTPVAYNDDVLGSIAMGLPAFDLLKNPATADTSDEITAPFHVNNLFSKDRTKDFDLSKIDGAKDYDAYIPSSDNESGNDAKLNDTFVNGVVMTEYNGQLFCQWQCSDHTEDALDTWVAYSVQNAEGKWSDPLEIATPDDAKEIKLPDGNTSNTGFYSSGGWYVNEQDNLLVAYLNYWPTLYNEEKQVYEKQAYGYTYYRTYDGEKWSTIEPVMMSDNTPLKAIFEQDPHVLESGIIVNAAHFHDDDDTETIESGLFVDPIYTKEKDGITGWVRADFTSQDNKNSTTQSRELEPSIFEKEDGNLVMIFRDQNGDGRVLAAESSDKGVSWTESAETTLPDITQKQSAGNLPDGTAYIVNCPVDSTTVDKPAANRYPLVITLSEDGEIFDTSYVVRSYYDAYDAKYQPAAGVGTSRKRIGYHYPKSVVIGDYLYVSYAYSKEDAEYVKIPLSSISLNKYKNTIQSIYDELTYSGDYTKLSNYGGNYSVTNASEITLADVYMAQRFLIECANAVADGKLELTDNNNTPVSATTIYDDVCESLKWIDTNLYNTDTGLYSNGYNTSSGKNSTYQAKGVGFYAMTLVDTIAMLPASMSAEKKELTDILSKLFDGMLNNGYQDSTTGMWKTDITASTDLSYEGSAMMSYALLKAYDEGIVSDDKYAEAGLLAFNGVVENKLAVATLSTETSSDESNASGLAPLMLASTLAEGVESTLSGENVVDVSSLSWKDIEVPTTDGKYNVVYNMSPDNKQGYVISRHGDGVANATINKYILTLDYQNYTHKTVGRNLSDFVNGFNSGKDDYSGIFDIINHEDLWCFEPIDNADFSKGGYIYSKYSNGKKYYLKAIEPTDTSATNGTISIVESDATVWKFERYYNNGAITARTYVYTEVGDENKLYICYTNSADRYESEKKDGPQNFYVSTSPNAVMLWTRETDPYDVALSGEKSYSVALGSTEVTEQSIKDNTKIYLTADSTAENPVLTEIKWDDDNIDVVWDKELNTLVPGTYTMSVTYYDQNIGDIAVTVTSDGWIDITEERDVFQIVQEMKTGEQYVIIGTHESNYYSLEVDSTNLTRTTQSEVTITNNNDDTYIMDSVGDYNIWQIDELARIYCDIGTYYYWNGSGVTSQYVPLVTATEAESTWNCTADGKLNVKFREKSNQQYLSFYSGGTNMFDIAAANNGGYASVTLYEKVDSYATMDTVAHYSMLQGSNEVTLESIKENITINLLEIVNGTATNTELPTSDSKLDYTWDKTFNKDIAGLYTLTVSYGDIELGKITVYVEAVDYKEIPNTTIKAALDGKTLYNVSVNDTSVSESIVKGNAEVVLYDTASGSISKISLDDPNVAYAWSGSDTKLDLTTEGVYIFTVYYKGVELGNVTVNVGDLTWTDVSTYKYNRVQTLEPGKYYVIADDVDSGSVGTLGIDAISPGYSAISNITVASNSDETYTLSGVTDNNNWYFETNGNIYGTVSGTKYNLLNYDDGHYKVRIMIDRYYESMLWSAVAGENGTVKLMSYAETPSRTTGQKTNYLAFNGSRFYTTADSSDVNTNLMLYSLEDPIAKEVTMVGETYYKELRGASDISETIIKANTKLFLEETSSSGETTTTQIRWNDENLSVSWAVGTVDSSGNVTWVDQATDYEFTDETIGKYQMTIKYQEKEIGKIVVDIVDISDAKIIEGSTAETGIGREPDFSNVKVELTYSDGSKETVTVEDGLIITDYKIDEANVYQADITYKDYTNENLTNAITVTVSSNPYHNLEAATVLPEYPKEGATRIDKTATNDEFDWYETGTTKVELDVAGISQRYGVDVVLVADVSNSMGRIKTVDGKDVVGKKLSDAMTAASDFAEILLGDNVEGSDKNNSLSFVTFAGYDADNYDNSTIEEGKSYVDSVQTVFTNVQTAQLAQNAFDNTKFNSYGNYAELQIGRTDGTFVKGEGRGGTNYDYAFAETINAVKELQASYGNYEATGRHTIVLFLTDGAPNHYNYEHVDCGVYEYVYGTKVFYPDVYSGSDTMPQEWKSFLTNNANVYAEELSTLVEEFYSVGFDLDDDTEADHTKGWTYPEDFVHVLEIVAGKDSKGNYNVDKVIIAEDGESLATQCAELATELTYSGKAAQVYDEIAADYTLDMSTNIKDLSGNDITGYSGGSVENKIQFITYDLYTADDVGDTINGVEVTESMIGLRTGTPVVVEEVTFVNETNEDGTTKIKAYSNQVDNKATDIYSTFTKIREDGTEVEVVQITAKNFTYTNEGGWEYFDWTIGDIADVEYALTYYAHLEGTTVAEGAWRPNGVYNTNVTANLQYIDIYDKHATKYFPIPNRPWGEAMTTIEYYLVNTNGEPVNRVGDVIPFAHRIRVDLENEYRRVREINWETSLTIAGEDHLPVGYKLYNPEAYYTVNVEALNKGTLYIYNGETMPNDTTTVWVNGGTPNVVDPQNVESTRVAFGVLPVDALKVKSRLNRDRVVMDYGKAIQVDVLANEVLQGTGAHEDYKFKAELVGFKHYSTDETLLDYIQSSGGSATYTGNYGEFSLATVDGKQVVNYQLKEMLSGVEKVFAVVKITQIPPGIAEEDADDYYYLCQELDIIPATNVYYETDFADGVFELTQTVEDESVKWQTEVKDDSTESGSDVVQDPGTIGVGQTYGYDSTYTDDIKLSDGDSTYVKGQGLNKTTATFEFTGSGFDIISRTGTNQGIIRVDIYDAAEYKKDNSVKALRIASVLNKSESQWELYQIPVLSIDMNDTGHGHGTYFVKITVMNAFDYAGDPNHALSRGDEFYFDGIRVYNPINVEKSDYVPYDSIDGMTHENYIKVTNDQLALSAYAKDGEAYPEMTEVRNILINAKDMDFSKDENNMEDGSKVEYLKGVIYVDKHLDENPDTVEFATYEKIGPNNEVYLSKGQGIAFKITGVPGTIAGIDIGAKSVAGTATYIQTRIANASSGYTYSATINKEVNSSTVQYYDLMADSTTAISNMIAADGSTYVFVTNGGDGILSITDVKIAYNPTTTEVEGQTEFVSDSSVSEFVTANMLRIPDYNANEAEFSIASAKVFGNASMEVVTSKDVVALEIKDRFGKSLDAEITYVDIDENRVWTVTILMTRIGNQKYIITGYGTDGTSGESATAEIEVTAKEGGGWQNAKSIYKTLFNCRILSIKRSSGSRL